MICRTSSNIWMRNTFFVVLVSISCVGFLWISCIILSLQGRRHDNDNHLSYDNKNNGVVQHHFTKIETIYRHFTHYLPKTRNQYTNNELFDEVIYNNMRKHGQDDDKIIHMKQSVSLSKSKRLRLLLEKLKINKLVDILHEDMMIIEENDSTSMKMKSISHGGNNDENDEDHFLNDNNTMNNDSLASIIKEKEEQSEYIIENGNSSTPLYEDDENDGDPFVNDNTMNNDSITSIIKEKEEQALYIIENGNTSTSLYHFYKHASGNLFIVYWKPDGFMDSESMCFIWWNVTSHSSDNQRQPTEYGTIALLLDHDYLGGIPWDVTPPVPLLLYSIPNDYYNPDPTSLHKLILVPEDRTGANEDSLARVMDSVLKKAYEDRQNIMVWRGRYHFEAQRLILLNNISSVDMNNNTWLDAKESQFNAIGRGKLAREYKYQLDVGGVSGTTWSSLRWKMCSGNVVFKVDSWSRDWWHDTIVPWEHYIPVKEDLSDLYEQYVWAESHPEEAYEIAQKGQKTCIETSQKDYMTSYETKIIQSLPPASEELVNELNLIREGYIALN